MGSVLGLKLDSAAAPRLNGVTELLVVVSIAAAGVLIAAVLALGPWSIVSSSHPPVTGFHPPAVTAPHG
jgi:hypothetical protein